MPCGLLSAILSYASHIMPAITSEMQELPSSLPEPRRRAQSVLPNIFRNVMQTRHAGEEADTSATVRSQLRRIYIEALNRCEGPQTKTRSLQEKANKSRGPRQGSSQIKKLLPDPSMRRRKSRTRLRIHVCIPGRNRLARSGSWANSDGQTTQRQCSSRARETTWMSEAVNAKPSSGRKWPR